MQAAGLHREFGRLDESLAEYDRAVELMGDEGDYLSRYWAHLGASDTAQRLGRLDVASTHLAFASEIADANWAADDIRMARLDAARAIQAWSRDDVEQARAHWHRVEQLAAGPHGLNELNVYLASRRYFRFLIDKGMSAEIDAIVARNNAFDREEIR